MSEEKYKKTINSLKSLPKVKAPDDFEQRVLRKVKLVDHETLAHQLSRKYSAAERKPWFAFVLKPSAVAALGFTVLFVAATLIYFNYFKQADQQKSIQPETLSKTETRTGTDSKPLITEREDFKNSEQTVSPKSTPPLTYSEHNFGYTKTKETDLESKRSLSRDEAPERKTEAPVMMDKMEKSQPMEKSERMEKKSAPKKGDDESGKITNDKDDSNNDGIMNQSVTPEKSLEQKELNAMAKDTTKTKKQSRKVDDDSLRTQIRQK